MPLSRLLRLLLILSPTLMLLGGLGWFIFSSTPRSDPSGSPVAGKSGSGRLVVVAVFDQMRGDYLERWASEFGKDGFERLKREGVWFSSAMLQYACSSTGPGHASISSGAFPSVHGIVENDWFDRGQGKMVQSWTDDSRRHERVPLAEGEARSWAGVAPTRMLVPAVADTLRTSSGGQAKCISIALKARAAVLMGGKNPTCAYCFDNQTGEFHTSTYYQDRLESWVTNFNQSGAANRWAGKVWERLKPAEIYERSVGPDDAAGEFATGGKPDRVFPHRIPKLDEAYYPALERSPFGNELVWDFARQCIASENLGNREQADLLYLGFSASDIIGHAFGPDSHEVMDATLRADQLVAQMLQFLDEHLGKDRYSLIITADHGICPTPEVAVRGHPTAKRIGAGDLVSGLDAALDETFGPPDGVAGRWVEGDFGKTYPWLYLNARTIESSGVPAEVLMNYVRTWLSNRPDTLAAFTRQELESKEPGEHLQLVRNAFHPDRCGDIYVAVKPYVLVTGGFSTGTNHGSLHAYDRHVPVLAAGAGVAKVGQVAESASSLIVAPLTAQLLGIKPPAEAKEPLPGSLQPRIAK